MSTSARTPARIPKRPGRTAAGVTPCRGRTGAAGAMAVLGRAVAAGVMAALALPGGARAAAESGDAPRQQVTIGPGYGRGAIGRCFWGADYRALWTTPLTVEVLDLRSFAGGLRPLFRVGGQETKGLAMKGGDGRSYTFRGIDKDPSQILPEDLRDTWARGIVQDQMAAQHPASPFVVDELRAAAGILGTAQRLYVMPDDAALGEFRKEFAGVVGQVYEFPGAKSEETPGFEGATALLGHEAFYQRLAAGPGDRPDARAFLKARLFDLMIGDWDRHRDQWRWARLPGEPLWQPIPDDRDQAFSRYEGFVAGLVRSRVPFLQNYGSRYPDMEGLTWNGREQDRELLAGLERPVFEEVASELRSAVTDAVIEKAARRMPPEYLEVDGERLVRDLKGRRDRLGEAAAAFYEHVADKVKVYLTDAPEHVEVKRLPGGDALVQAWRAGEDGAPAGEPFYRRTLHPAETREVQVYLRGGDDRVVTLGEPRGITLRVVGGAGRDVVDDSKGGGTRFYDQGAGRLVAGPRSHLDRGRYTPPPPPKNAPWIPPRDWGRDAFWLPWVGYGADVGAFLGLGVDTQAHAFRKHPYANRHVLRAGWSLGDSTFRADYRADFRFENSGWTAGWYAYASGIESSRFFGFGNETGDGGDQNSDFFKVNHKQYSLTPGVGIPIGTRLSFFVGPTVKYASNTHRDEDTLINRTRPYGYGSFGEVGATGILELDTRVAATRNPTGVAFRSIGYPRGGALVHLRGQVWPKAWDVRETFGLLDGSAAVFLTPGGERAPTLALRAGGRRLFGDYPFFEAAYLGGGLGGIDTTAGDEPVRGLQRHRYAGDGAAHGNAELRLYVSRFSLFLPGTWGLFGFGDGGRVWFDGDVSVSGDVAVPGSDKWHYGYGGGLWFAWLDRANTLSLTYARSEGRNAVYFKAGFAY